MDENSRECESETPKQTENVSDFSQTQNLSGTPSFDCLRDNRQSVLSSADASGPSSVAAPTSVADGPEAEEFGEADGGSVPCLFGPRKSGYDIVREYQPFDGTGVVEGPLERTAIGPPPSYSFVMKQKKKFSKLPVLQTSMSNRGPSPTYGGTRGIFLPPEDPRICNLSSFPEPIWRSHSQPALCPRCGIIILTSTHSHDSVATHVAALALCLFGCWPCCLLPYCLSICKNTYHHCPICQAYLGAYTPW